MSELFEFLKTQFKKGNMQGYIEKYGEDMLPSILEYIWQCGPAIHRKTIADMFEKNIPGSMEEINTIENSILFKGLQEGIEQGKKQEKLKIAKILITKNFEIEEISELTELPIETIEQLAQEIGDN